jgi:hypothetical protein
MEVYRIEQRTETYDCWGRTEWNCWRQWGDKVYATKDKAQDVMRKHGLHDSPNHEFRIKEIDLVTEEE